MRTTLTAMLAFLALAATAATFTVATDGSGQYTTVADAVAAANASADPASEVVLKAGDYPVAAPVTLSGPVTVKSQSGNPADTSVYTLAANGVFILASGDAVLSGICVSNGTATSACTGGNVTVTDGGTVTNCWIAYGKAGNAGGKRGGGIGGMNVFVTHCRFFGNKTTGNGLGTGIYATGDNTVITRSEFFNNRNANGTDSGNGAIWIGEGAATISHCIVTNNYAGAPCARSAGGGGIYCADNSPALIEWCFVADNTAGQQTGGGGICHRCMSGLIRHCTVVNNLADFGGGVSGYYGNTAAMENCIVWNNEGAYASAAGQPEFHGSGYFRAAVVSNVCSSVSIGTGPMVADPMFADAASGDYRLSKNSPCIGAGTDGLDLGCFPHDTGDFECGILVDAIAPQREGVRTFTAVARGAAVSSPSFRWSLDDGGWSAWSPNAAFAPDLAPGPHTIRLEAKDGSFTDSAERAYLVAPADVYLAKDGAAPAEPYATRATAATDFAEALRYCADGTTLHVSDGDYPATSALRVRPRVAIISDNGPAKTSLYRPGPYKGGASFRIVHLLSAGSLFSGFTVSNGFSASGRSITGSAAAFAGSTVSNCVFTKNCHTGSGYSGGATVLCDNSHFTHVEVSANEIVGVGGAGGAGGGMRVFGGSSLVEDSLFANNHGSMYYLYGAALGIQSPLNNSETVRIVRCAFINNSTYGSRRNNTNGGPAGAVFVNNYNAVFENCLFAGNSAGSSCGAIWQQTPAKSVTCVNCTFQGNFSNRGPAVCFADNASAASTFLNCIFDGNYTNTLSYSVGDFWNLPAASATIGGNCFGAPSAFATPADIVADPRFRDAAGGDYRLSSGSPARDIGQAYDWHGGALDIARRGRAWGGTPDAGCLEYRNDATVLRAR